MTGGTGALIAGVCVGIVAAVVVALVSVYVVG